MWNKRHFYITPPCVVFLERRISKLVRGLCAFCRMAGTQNGSKIYSLLAKKTDRKKIPIYRAFSDYCWRRRVTERNCTAYDCRVLDDRLFSCTKPRQRFVHRQQRFQTCSVRLVRTDCFWRAFWSFSVVGILGRQTMSHRQQPCSQRRNLKIVEDFENKKKKYFKESLFSLATLALVCSTLSYHETELLRLLVIFLVPWFQ